MQKARFLSSILTTRAIRSRSGWGIARTHRCICRNKGLEFTARFPVEFLDGQGLAYLYFTTSYLVEPNLMHLRAVAQDEE
jgi:hypothetical protein